MTFLLGEQPVVIARTLKETSLRRSDKGLPCSYIVRRMPVLASRCRLVGYT